VTRREEAVLDADQHGGNPPATPRAAGSLPHRHQGRSDVLARRALLSAGLAGLAVAPLAVSARARGGPRGELVRSTAEAGDAAAPGLSCATLIVAGPPDPQTRRWAAPLISPLAAALHPGGDLTMQAVGGRDGVTAANAFDSLASNDGCTALLVPGAAFTAWLAGDPRVHFDVGRWVAAFASDGPVVLFGRPLARQAVVRVASSTPTGIELAALLGLALLGESPQPVDGLAEPADARDALLQGRVDAIMLSGPDVASRMRELTRPGLVPLLSLDPGTLPNQAAPPHLPRLDQLYAARFGGAAEGHLFEAWRATAVAASLQSALVLQPLTPAALVAQWRGACARAADDQALGASASESGLRLLAAPDCVGVLSNLILSPASLLALRGWLNRTPGRRPA